MNPNDLTLHQSVMNVNIERTTVGPIQMISVQPKEPRYGALLINSDGDDVQNIEQVFKFIFHFYNFAYLVNNGRINNFK